jgi:deazaflavin-dependent oxidoreductase (nitroreductase family)
MDGADVVLVASNGGAVRDPTWWLNLQTTPEAWIQIKGTRRRVKSERASVAEKQRLWPRLIAMYPGYKRYQEITDRDIPVVILHSTEGYAEKAKT